MKQRLLLVFFFLLATVGGAACHRPIVYGTEQELAGFTRLYKKVERRDVFEAARQALIQEGYKVESAQADEGTLRTGWTPARAASHYVDLFGRRDYSTVGAYYRLEVRIEPGEEGQEVEIRGTAKSTISNLQSSGSEEQKIFKHIANLVRSPSIEITNVGMSEQ